MQKCIDYKSQLCFNGHKKLDLILEFTTHNAQTFICTVNVHVLHVNFYLQAWGGETSCLCS